MRVVPLLAAFVLMLAGASLGHAQVPTIDSANLAKAQQIAVSTQQILSSDQQILQFTQKTLQAVTGDRSTQAQGSLAKMALGSGFSMGQAPSLGSVISGGTLSFAGMGAASQNMVSTRACRSLDDGAPCRQRSSPRKQALQDHRVRTRRRLRQRRQPPHRRPVDGSAPRSPRVGQTRRPPRQSV